MAKTLSLKHATFLYEQNFDRKKRPTAMSGRKAAFTIGRVLDQKGKIVKKLPRDAKSSA